VEAPYALDVADGFAEVDRIRAEPSRRDALIALLAEQAPAYRGLSSNQSARLRGYVLASFETVGLPAPAMAFVIEELESGIPISRRRPPRPSAAPNMFPNTSSACCRWRSSASGTPTMWCASSPAMTAPSRSPR
jgi:hypothetical protein